MAVEKVRKFPKDPLLVKLLQSAKRTAGGHVVHDAYGFDKTYAELLADIVQTRDALWAHLAPTTLTSQGQLHQDRPYICTLTLSGYEFMVAFFAIRAVGGACVPFASGILPEEAEYFVSNTKATCLLAGRSRTEQAARIVQVAKQHGADTMTLLISSNVSPLEDDVEVEIDEFLEVDPRGPGMILFTSGTTGPPKGAVLPKVCFAAQVMAEPDSTTVSFRPPHWIGGMYTLIVPPTTGKKVYILKERANTEAIWEVFKKERITDFIFTPTVLREMKELYTDRLSELPEGEREKYLVGFKNMSKITCGGAMISPTVLTFWTSISRLPFESGYGSTEVGGGVLYTDVNRPTLIEHSVGFPERESGVQFKLSEGDHGEILIKSPSVMTHYIGDEKATKGAFDEQGYLKTGDLGHMVDGECVFDGRTSADYVFFHGYRIPRIRVEDALASLPYISEAYVVGVPDHEAKELCGALVRASKGVAREEVTLARIRADLADALPAHMRPSLLRVMDGGDEVPYTVSLKPLRREIIRRFFCAADYWSVEDPTPGVESWGNLPDQQEAETKPWDWCGLQRSD